MTAATPILALSLAAFALGAVAIIVALRAERSGKSTAARIERAVKLVDRDVSRHIEWHRTAVAPPPKPRPHPPMDDI